MKKILTLCVAVMAAVTMSAKTYEHSIGVVGGLGLGAQYKTMLMDNFTLIDEFGYFLCISNGSYAGAIDNLVLAYQAPAAEGQGIKLEWYAGGQIKMGYEQTTNGGLFGIGGAAGIEAIMKGAPIAFSFDFRPGYGLVYFNTGFGGMATGHMFDYSFNLGVRYIIPTATKAAKK